jgi:hypothetical protein
MTDLPEGKSNSGVFMPTPSVISQYQYPQSINRRYWDSRYLFDDFTVNPVTSKVGGGAATGTAGDNNVLYTQFGQYEWNVIGTQTILAPSLDTFGLNLVQDNTAGDGIELCCGQTALCPYAFTVGSDAAFFMQSVFKVQDVSGINPLLIGFRAVAAFNATLSSYTDFATIGIVGTAAKVQLQTQKATAGVTTTDTTQTATDGATIQFKVSVDANGAVTYQYNYGVPTVVAAFSFNAGTVLIPFIRSVEAADITTQASCNYLEVGFVS